MLETERGMQGDRGRIVAAVSDHGQHLAQAQRLGFFDWSAEVTRSPCRLPDMARADPPLLRPDYVHFTPDGYRLTAERLNAHLLRGMGLGARITSA